MEKDTHLCASDLFLNAVLEGDALELARLLKTDVSTESFRENGSKWLRVAAREGSLNSVKVLIGMLAELDIGVNISDPKLGRTALHEAARLLSPGICFALIEAGAKVDVVDVFGRSALHFAVFFSKADCAIALIQAGANISIKDKKGFTAMDCSKVATQAFGPNGTNQIEAFLNARQALAALNSVWTQGNLKIPELKN